MLGKGAGKRPIGGGSGEGAHWRRDAGEGVLEGGYLGRGPIGGDAGKGVLGRGPLERESVGNKVSYSVTFCSHCRAC